MPDISVFDIVSISIGLIGVLLAVISLVLHKRRRLAELKPRLSSKLSWSPVKDSPAPALRLDIWNVGRLPVNVRKVQLLWGRENKETREIVSKLGLVPFDRSLGVPMTTASDEPLCECECRTFILPPLPPSIMRQAANQPDDRIWIAVESDNGELLRLKGDRILPFLQT